jgi:hypothetical protein
MVMGAQAPATTAELKAKTNNQQNSMFDVTGLLMPARAFFFIVVEEPGKDGFLVRKTYATVNDPYLRAKNLPPQRVLATVFPEKFGLFPFNENSTALVAEHVLGYDKITQNVSTSTRFPDGSPRFQGKVVYVDTAKAIQSGAKLVTTDEILTALQTYKNNNPHPHVIKDVNRISNYVRNIDKEVLVTPPKTGVPPSAVFTPESLSTAKNIARGARVVQVFAIVLTAYDLEQATEKSIQVRSAKPITAEVIRQAGGWGGAIAGFKIGAAGGALIGIETGPGAIITGLIGGIFFGAAGYYGADWVADHIDEN